MLPVAWHPCLTLQGIVFAGQCQLCWQFKANSPLRWHMHATVILLFQAASILAVGAVLQEGTSCARADCLQMQSSSHPFALSCATAIHLRRMAAELLLQGCEYIVATAHVLGCAAGLQSQSDNAAELCHCRCNPTLVPQLLTCCRSPEGTIQDVTPGQDSGFNVRTRVHEYGGAPVAVGKEAIYFSNFK